MSKTQIPYEQLRDGLALIWRGAWELGQAYDTNHLVRYEGSVYVSLVDQSVSVVGTEPTVGENWELVWDLFLSRGEQGESGEGRSKVRETPAGLLDGNNRVFTLSETPREGMEEVFINGLLMEPGAGNDYQIAGAVITLEAAPDSLDRIRVSYIFT